MHGIPLCPRLPDSGDPFFLTEYCRKLARSQIYLFQKYRRDTHLLACCNGNCAVRDISETRRKQIEQRKLAESHYAFSQSIIANFDSDEAFESLLTILLDTFSCNAADLSCLDKNELICIMHIRGYDLTSAEDQCYTEGFQVTDDYISQRVVSTGQPFLLGDIRENPSYHLILAADNRSFLAVPVQLEILHTSTFSID